MPLNRTPLDAYDAFEEVLQHKKHTDKIWACAVSPDGRIVASSSRDKTARVFRVEGQEEIKLQQPHGDTVYDIAIDGRHIATAGRDGVVYVRKLSNPSTYILKEGNGSGWALSAKLSAGGKKVAFSMNQTVFVNKIATKENLHKLQTKYKVVRIAANKDQTTVFILGKINFTDRENFLLVWDINGGAETRDTNVPIADTEHHPGIATNAAGDLLAIADHDSLRLWKVGADSATSLPKYYPPDDDEGCDCSLTPDGRCLVASMGQRGFGVWDCNNNSRLYATAEYSVVACAISDNGRTIVFGCKDYSVHVWSLKPSFEIPNGEHGQNQVARREDIDRIEKNLQDLRNALRTALQNLASAL